MCSKRMEISKHIIVKQLDFVGLPTEPSKWNRPFFSVVLSYLATSASKVRINIL